MTQSQQFLRVNFNLKYIGIRRIMGASRQCFYNIRKAYESGGIHVLPGYNRRNKPLHKNLVSQETSGTVVALTGFFPAFGQVRDAS